MEKNGQMLEHSDYICHLSLYFYCCGPMIGWECTSWYGIVVFLKFYYLRVSINTLLCKSNLIYSESLLSYSRERRQSIEPH